MTKTRSKRRWEKAVDDFFESDFEELSKDVLTVGSEEVDVEEESEFITARALLEPEIEKTSRRIAGMVEAGEPMSKEEVLVDQLRSFIRVEEALRILLDSGTGRRPVYLFEEKVLRRCANLVDYSNRNKEDAVLVSGPSFCNLRIPLWPVQFKKASSRLGIKSEDRSLSEVVVEMRTEGYEILSLVHSHPGERPPGPSDTDLGQQDYYESRDLDVLGLIFTSNGLMRAYSKDMDFELLIHGDGGIRREKDGLYRIDSKTG